MSEIVFQRWYNVKGYDFYFTKATYPQLVTGVVCTDTTAFANPEYLAALTYAIENFDVFAKLSGFAQAITRKPNVASWSCYGIDEIAKYVRDAEARGFVVAQATLDFLAVAVPIANAEFARINNPYYGFVYLVHLHDEIYKIGCTREPRRRLPQLRRDLKLPITQLCLIESDDMYELEGKLHDRFADKRTGTHERFRLTPEDIDYIKGLAA